MWSVLYVRHIGIETEHRQHRPRHSTTYSTCHLETALITALTTQSRTDWWPPAAHRTLNRTPKHWSKAGADGSASNRCLTCAHDSHHLSTQMQQNVNWENGRPIRSMNAHRWRPLTKRPPPLTGDRAHLRAWPRPVVVTATACAHIGPSLTGPTGPLAAMPLRKRMRLMVSCCRHDDSQLSLAFKTALNWLITDQWFVISSVWHWLPMISSD